MKEYIEEVTALKNYIQVKVQVLNDNKDNADVVNEVCCDLQQRVIDLGTRMENESQLQGTRILHLLEMFCEVFYRVMVGEMNLDSFNKFMRWQLYHMEYEYFWSVPVGARELSIAAIIKNERDILEWIEYHRIVGVQHFYIYDNESTDGLEEKLKPYVEEGLVTYIYFPGKYKQFDAYNHAIEHFKYETRWLAVVDGDEYIVPMEEGKKLPEILNGIEKHYMGLTMRTASFVGAVGANWRNYGTSGIKTPCEGLIIENYKNRAEDDYFQHAHIKSIYNPRVVSSIGNPHFGYFRDSAWITISENGSAIFNSYFYDSMCKKIRINHYFSKSEQELVSKNKRGWPDKDLYREDSKELYEAGVNCNKVYDPIMDRYVDEIKAKLNGGSS